MEKEFIKFLKGKRLFTKYKSRAKEYFYTGSNTHSFERVMERLADFPERFVVGGFTWDKTPEGRDFWLNISEEWEVECLKLQG